MSLSKELESRGFINQFSAPTLQEIVDGEKRTIYHGIDPTADSAHVGNLAIWMLLLHLAKTGHKIIFLVGGGTGLIGDPKPDTERQLKDTKDVSNNVEKIKKQAEAFFSNSDIEFVNNLEWLSELKIIDFLREVGKHYTVNELIKKDAIATRLQSDTGLSYTEFAYPLLQGFDYLQLFESKNCTVQVGGSDQWGNIISGVELIRRKKQAEVFAITVPLIIDKTTGKKFGKSEGNAVWLDVEKTSPYTFYQFWLNVADENVIDYLKIFSLTPLEEISEIEREHELNPGLRIAQKKLAKEVTTLVHKEHTTTAVENVSNMLFGERKIDELSEVEKDILIKNAPTVTVSLGKKIVDILVESRLATSKREARMFIESGAVSLHDSRIEEVESVLSENHFTHHMSILKRGKKNICILVLE